jgi:anti-anti-sigma factor
MEINIIENSDPIPVVILRISGNLDAAGADEFEKSINGLLLKGVNNILLDLRGVTFMSSAGIRSINIAFYALHHYDQKEFKEVISKGIRDGTYKAPHLKILNPPKQVMQSFKMVGVDMYLGIYSDEGQAIQSFTEIAS